MAARAGHKVLDRPKEADDALRQAIEANTRFSKSYVALGYLYLDYDFNKEAAQVFQGCVTAKEDDGECHNGYGLALKNLKQYEQATAEFKKAIDLDPELYDALYNAGMAYSDWFDEAHGNDQKDKAREYLQKFVTNGGKSADGNYVRRPTTSCTPSARRAQPDPEAFGSPQTRAAWSPRSDRVGLASRSLSLFLPCCARDIKIFLISSVSQT